MPSPTSTKLETDDKGKISLALKPGGYALFVRASGFKVSSTHFDVNEAKEEQLIPVLLQIGANSGPIMVVPASSRSGLAVYAFPYHNPVVISLAELSAMAQTTVTIHNTHTNADETYTGVRLANLLTQMGAPLGSELHGEALSNYVVASGSDGYQAVFALAEIDPSFHPGEVLVANKMNGKPLDEHSGPLKLVVTEDKRPARSVRDLTAIELKTTP